MTTAQVFLMALFYKLDCNSLLWLLASPDDLAAEAVMAPLNSLTESYCRLKSSLRPIAGWWVESLDCLIVLNLVNPLASARNYPQVRLFRWVCGLDGSMN